VFKIFSGFWIYLLTLFLLSIFGFFLFFRFNNPTISLERLIDSPSNFSVSQSNPCFLHIIGGVPFSPSPDGNIQANILCPEGNLSPNYLKFSALEKNNPISVLKILSSVNNFKYQIDNQNKIESLGDIKNTPKKQWYIFVNNVDASNLLDKNILKISDVVEFKYE